MIIKLLEKTLQYLTMLKIHQNNLIIHGKNLSRIIKKTYSAIH